MKFIDSIFAALTCMICSFLIMSQEITFEHMLDKFDSNCNMMLEKNELPCKNTSGISETWTHQPRANIIQPTITYLDNSVAVSPRHHPARCANKAPKWIMIGPIVPNKYSIVIPCYPL